MKKFNEVQFTVCVIGQNGHDLHTGSYVNAADPRNAVIAAVATYGENVRLYDYTGEVFGDDAFVYEDGNVFQIDVYTGRRWKM